MNQRGAVQSYLILLLIAVGLGFALVGNMRSNTLLRTQKNPYQAVQVKQSDPVNSQNKLQLETFGYITPTPTPVVYCDLEGKVNNCTCQPSETISRMCPYYSGDYSHPCPDGGKALGYGKDALFPGDWCMYIGPNSGGYPTNPAYDKYLNDPNCSGACYGKPVIYLYPEKETLVNVTLKIPGQITNSDPQYPVGGWQNVLAHPDGTLLYQGKTYHELYYESEVSQHVFPTTGAIVSTNELKHTLAISVTQLGLLPKERDEFLMYWLPKLYALRAPFIQFSVLTPEQKDSVDHIDISPKPDTAIYFLVYFKPVFDTADVHIAPLELPNAIQKRVGFTAVEWGGTIASR